LKFTFVGCCAKVATVVVEVVEFEIAAEAVVTVVVVEVVVTTTDDDGVELFAKGEFVALAADIFTYSLGKKLFRFC
jgi:hypothetical protein